MAMNWVTDAKYINGYEIRVKFNDGREENVNLESTIINDHREIFKALIDKEQFKRFRVDSDTIVWENGLDLAPEFLYEMASISLKKAS